MTEKVEIATKEYETEVTIIDNNASVKAFYELTRFLDDKHIAYNIEFDSESIDTSDNDANMSSESNDDINTDSTEEIDQEKLISDLSDQVCEYILNLKEGTETSISEIVYELQRTNRFEAEIDDWDLWEVEEIVQERLSGKRILDKSKYDDISAGLPYNIPFVVRKVN